MTETSAAPHDRAALPTLSAASAPRPTPARLPVLPAPRTSMLTVGTFALLLVSSPVAAAQSVEVAQPVIAVRAAGAQQVAADHPDEVVGLSTDGTPCSRPLSDLLGPVQLSPGDHVDDSFWVPDAGARPARLTSPTEGGLLARTSSAPLASTGGVAGGLTVGAGGLLALGLVVRLAARPRRDHDTEPDGPETPNPAARELLP